MNLYVASSYAHTFNYFLIFEDFVYRC